MRNHPLYSLDQRKQVILRAVVNDYVSTAEPVGSKTLMARYELGVKSATIRNEMAELAEWGYLRQPHTSAGRIPSDMGYRFYVDRLMGRSDLPVSDVVSVRRRLKPRSEVDIIIEQTCKILSDLAHYTSVATPPAMRDSYISHISVTSVGHRKLLVVLVLSSGGVFHELMEFDPNSKKIDPVRATNFLMDKLDGVTLEEAAKAPINDLPVEVADMADFFGRVLQFIDRKLQEIEDTEIHFEGTNYIMQQPEFKDIERLETLLSILEKRAILSKLFSSVYAAPEVTVVIGAENPVNEMRDCSFVGTKYRIGDRVVGTIGVVGPTRMDYHRAVGAVSFMARNLGEVLEKLMVS